MPGSTQISIGTVTLGMVLAMAAPAHALPRTFVSGTGSDGNPCTASQPCLSFQHAHDVTDPSGEISCLNAASVSGTDTCAIDRRCMTRERRRREREWMEVEEGLIRSSDEFAIRGGARPGVSGVEDAREVVGRKSMRLFF